MSRPLLLSPLSSARMMGFALAMAALAGCGQQGAQQKMPPPVVGFIVIKTQPVPLTAELAGQNSGARLQCHDSGTRGWRNGSNKMAFGAA